MNFMYLVYCKSLSINFCVSAHFDHERTHARTARHHKHRFHVNDVKRLLIDLNICRPQHDKYEIIYLSFCCVHLAVEPNGIVTLWPTNLYASVQRLQPELM